MGRLRGARPLRGRYVSVALLVVVTTLILGACGGGEPPPGTQPAPDEPVEVRVITVGPASTGAWDPAHKAAYDKAAAENNWNVQVAEAVAYGDADQVLDRWGAEGVDVVFSTDNGYEDNLLAAAEKYPETAFVMMSALSTTDDLPNVAAYNFSWCEYGYLQGTIGGIATRSGTIGSVGSIDILPTTQALAAQRLGAAAVNPTAQVISQNTGDFADVQKAQAVTAGLVGSGADVIIALVHGVISPQIAAQAQSLGVRYVGSFADESASAPQATVGNVVINFGDDYVEAVRSWLDGTFEPTVHTGGVADGAIGVTPLAQGLADRQTDLDAAVEALRAGSVQWPADTGCAA
jgi:basic membrane protein A and related proteins